MAGVKFEVPEGAVEGLSFDPGSPSAFKDFGSELDKGGKNLIMRFEADMDQGPMRWLLQFGSRAEVLAPPALRDRVREDLELPLKAYREWTGLPRQGDRHCRFAGPRLSPWIPTAFACSHSPTSTARDSRRPRP